MSRDKVLCRAKQEARRGKEKEERKPTSQFEAPSHKECIVLSGNTGSVASNKERRYGEGGRPKEVKKKEKKSHRCVNASIRHAEISQLLGLRKCCDVRGIIHERRYLISHSRAEPNVLD